MGGYHHEDLYPHVTPRSVGGGDYTIESLDISGLDLDACDELASLLEEATTRSAELDRLVVRLRKVLHTVEQKEMGNVIPS